MRITQKKSTGIAADKSQGHREDKFVGMWTDILDQHEQWHRRHGGKVLCMSWFPTTQLNDKIISHKIPVRPWESVRADFLINNSKHYLCPVDYHSKFLMIKWVEGINTDNPIQTCKIIFSEYELLSRIVSDTGTNSVSQKFENFCKCLSIHHAMSSSYNHQSNRQGEACIKFVKRMIQTCIETNADIYMALLQNRSTPISPRSPSLAMLLFNRPKRGILPKFNRLLVLCNNNESQTTPDRPS